jgi:hypothetical protein
MKRMLWLAAALGVAIAAVGADSVKELSKALTFHSSFDKGIDADFALGDRRLHTATSYQKREDARPGLGNPDVALAPGRGRFGGALEFKKKNQKAIYYPGEKNVAYQPDGWNGSVSFWLSLDPETDLEPGFCDPIQVTDADYNDGAIWVDFSRDEKPRLFRLGVFGDLKAWNPQNIPPDKNPDFKGRLVPVERPPFGKGKWTHIAITWSSLGSGKGVAKLYLDGKARGAAEGIREPFTVDIARNAIRLGVNYVGLFDEVAVFNRALTDAEIEALNRLDKGAATLHGGK